MDGNDQLELAIRGLITDYGRKPTYPEVRAANSCDTLSDNKIRHPFRYRGALHIATGGCSCGKRHEINVVELIPAKDFKGPTTNYQGRIARDGGYTARNDPRSFYYGMAIKWGGNPYVLGRETMTLVFEAEELIAEKPSERHKRALNPS